MSNTNNKFFNLILKSNFIFDSQKKKKKIFVSNYSNLCILVYYIVCIFFLF